MINTGKYIFLICILFSSSKAEAFFDNIFIKQDSAAFFPGSIWVNYGIQSGVTTVSPIPTGIFADINYVNSENRLINLNGSFSTNIFYKLFGDPVYHALEINLTTGFLLDHNNSFSKFTFGLGTIGGYKIGDKIEESCRGFLYRRCDYEKDYFWLPAFSANFMTEFTLFDSALGLGTGVNLNLNKKLSFLRLSLTASIGNKPNTK